MKNKMEVRIEKEKEGTYIAYNPSTEGMVAIGTGATVAEAKADFLNSLEEIAADLTEEEKARLMGEPEFHFDVSSLLEYYRVINVSAFAESIGMNASLLRQYKRGDTYISEAQLARIEEGFRNLGEELSRIRLH